MQGELEKLRINKEHKAKRDEKSRWPLVLLVLLIGGGAFGYFQWRNASAAVVVQTMRVRVPEGAVNESDLVALQATGYITAAHKIELASKVIGRVAWVGVEMGDKVAKGQVLVRLEDDEYRARVAEQQGTLDNARARLAELEAGSRPEEVADARAQVEQAESQLANAESNLARLRALASNNYLSKQEMDDAETLVRSRKAEVDSRRQRYEMTRQGPRKEQIAAQAAVVRQLEASLTQSTLNLDYTIIRAPVDATVLSRNVEVGEFVTNGFVGDRGAKGYVVSLADLNDLRVELDVSQNDFAKVAINQPCWITTDAYPDRKYDGKVDLISPEANRQKATVQVRVKVIAPDELLKPDMNSTVAFLSLKKQAAGQAAASSQPSERPAIRIPAGAIRDGAIFVVENGKAARKSITAGSTNAANETEVRKGLIGGEDLILSPPAGLKDGDPVKLPVNPR